MLSVEQSEVSTRQCVHKAWCIASREHSFVVRVNCVTKLIWVASIIFTNLSSSGAVWLEWHHHEFANSNSNYISFIFQTHKSIITFQVSKQLYFTSISE